MGTCKVDLIVKPLFALVHFHVLQTFFVVFPLCLFPLLVDDTHILGPISVLPLIYDHFASQLVSMGLAI